MINIGRYNHLKVARLVDFGACLDAGEGLEILMPAKYMREGLAPGDEVDVFVYTDSQDRLVAATEHPFAMVGEFAYLAVAQVNSYGAFLDWGISSKQLLVPYREQKTEMREGGIYLVYVYLDDTTKRVVASAKVDKFLGNTLPRYRRGQKVKALVTEHTPIGYRCIVDDLHRGMIYSSDLHSPLTLEQTIDAYVQKVRDDNKIDLTLSDRADRRTSSLADTVLRRLMLRGGFLPLNDKSSPAEIEAAFGCSKRDFKQALGHLYKARLITIADGGIRAV